MLGLDLGKIIHDTIYGSIELDGVLLELIDTPEVQRLRSVKQLGLSYLVFPGANHSRFEHSLGTCFMAGKIGKELGLDKDQVLRLKVAGLLHDIGHGPFSHSLERLYDEFLGKDHMDISSEIINGDEVYRDDVEYSVDTIPEILRDHGFDPGRIAGLASGGRDDFMGEVLHGNMDADQMDYLLRDSHYTGVAHGIIDWERVTKVLERYEDRLVVREKGVESIEGMLVARNLMYSSVYFHHTSTIAESMLLRATRKLVKAGDLEGFYRFVDRELLAELRNDPRSRRLVNLIKYRRILKRGPVIHLDDLDDDLRAVLTSLYNDFSSIIEFEELLGEKLGIDSDLVALNFSTRQAFLEESGDGIGINVKVDNGFKDISKFSSMVEALKDRQTPRWILLCGLPSEERNSLGKEELIELLKDFS